MSTLRPVALLALSSLAAGCDCGDEPWDADAAVDGGVDAATDAPFDAGGPTSLPCGDAVVVVEHAPFAWRIEDASGRVLLRPPEGEASFSLATAPAPSPHEYFDPRGDDRVSWAPVGTVRGVASAEGEATFTADSEAAERFETTVSCVDPGHVVVDARAVMPVDVVLARASFATDPGDRYHGLGEQFTGVDSRGYVRAMQLHVDGRTEAGHNDVHVPVPFVVSPRGWGMFVETRRAGAFDVGATDAGVLSATFDDAALRLHVWVGAPIEIVAAYTRLSGAPRVPPPWGFGAHFWRNENSNGDEVLADVDRFRALDIPTSVVWIDNPWQTSYNDLTFDPARFPDAGALISALHERGLKVLLWSTPYLDAVEAGADPANPAEELFVDARAERHLIRDAFGATYLVPWGGGPLAGMIDFSSPEASAFWTDVVSRATGLGVDGFKLDYAEEVMVELIRIRLGMQFANGETEATMHGVYSNLYHRAYQAALEQDRPEGFVIGRATTWGGQSDVECIWPGDLDSGFERAGVDGAAGGLPAAVAALQSLAASGFPVFGSDTGGFRNGLPTKEALLRWAGHTAFSPVLQLGGGGESHAPWAYDDETVDAYRRFARWHVDLAPTMQALVAAASATGAPVVRAMALAFPDDSAALDLGDQYLLGPDVLVAPLVDGGDTRSVYLPAGRWLDLFTGATLAGPTTAERATPLDEVPAYLRAGGVLVLGASDVDTLVATDDPEIVDAGDRAAVRRVLAFGDTPGTSAAADPRVTIARAGDVTTVGADGGGGVLELLYELRFPDAEAARAEGDALALAASPADVTAGCGCWAFDPTARVLWVGAAADAEFTVR